MARLEPGPDDDGEEDCGLGEGDEAQARGEGLLARYVAADAGGDEHGRGCAGGGEGEEGALWDAAAVGDGGAFIEGEEGEADEVGE